MAHPVHAAERTHAAFSSPLHLMRLHHPHIWTVTTPGNKASEALILSSRNILIMTSDETRRNIFVNRGAFSWRKRDEDEMKSIPLNTDCDEINTHFFVDEKRRDEIYFIK